jgi:MFS family permease
MPARVLFILFLACTLCGEGMLTVTLTWTILDKGGSVTHLGIILALMSILPFLIQKYSKKIRKQITQKPLQVFSIVRFIGIVIVFLSIINFDQLNVLNLYILASLFSIILFLSTQSLETYMSHLVLDGKISASEASNNLQTSIQIGAFGGNALAGFLMNLGGFKFVLYGLTISLGIGIFLPIVLPLLNINNREQITKSALSKSNDNNSKLSNNTRILWLSVTGIAVLTIQLAAFNFLVPVLFYDIYHFDPMHYGLVSSAAGVGALLATLVGKFERFIPIQIFLLIAVFDIVIGLTKSWYLSMIAAFGLGFAFNRSRITQRTIMFKFLKVKEETSIWASRSTLAFQFTKAFLPLILSFPLQWIGTNNTGNILGVIGGLVSFVMFIIYLFEVKYIKLSQKEQQLDVPIANIKNSNI